MNFKMNHTPSGFLHLRHLNSSYFPFQLQAQSVTIPIETNDHAIVLQTDKNNLVTYSIFWKEAAIAG